jgi:hypothetical protein
MYVTCGVINGDRVYVDPADQPMPFHNPAPASVPTPMSSLAPASAPVVLQTLDPIDINLPETTSDESVPETVSPILQVPLMSWADALKEADAASPYRNGLVKLQGDISPKRSKGKIATKSPAPAVASPPPSSKPSSQLNKEKAVDLNNGSGTPKKLAERRQSRMSISAMSDAKYTLPFAIGEAEQILARDSNGLLVVIKLVNHDAGKDRKPAVVAVETGEAKVDKKAALASLLKFPGGGGGGGGAGTSSAPKGGPSTNKGPALAVGFKDKPFIIPAPPPLPTTWPPVPYTKAVVTATTLAPLPGSGGTGEPAKPPEPGAKIKHLGNITS